MKKIALEKDALYSLTCLFLNGAPTYPEGIGNLLWDGVSWYTCLFFSDAILGLLNFFFFVGHLNILGKFEFSLSFKKIHPDMQELKN